MSMKKNLSKLEHMPLRKAWMHEANDFKPWLAHATAGNDGPGEKTYCQGLTVTTAFAHPRPTATALALWLN